MARALLRARFLVGKGLFAVLLIFALISILILILINILILCLIPVDGADIGVASFRRRKCI